MDKVKKVNNDSIVAYVDRDCSTGKFFIQCSARYTEGKGFGIITNFYEVPDKLPLEEAAKYSKELFRYSLIKQGYEVEDE